MDKANFLSIILCVGKEPNKPITVVYVPSHLYHMAFELFKVLWSVTRSLCSNKKPSCRT